MPPPDTVAATVRPGFRSLPLLRARVNPYEDDGRRRELLCRRQPVFLLRIRSVHAKIYLIVLIVLLDPCLDPPKFLTMVSEPVVHGLESKKEVAIACFLSDLNVFPTPTPSHAKT